MSENQHVTENLLLLLETTRREEDRGGGAGVGITE